MATYQWRDGGFQDKKTGERMCLPDRHIQAPMVMKDVPEYASPIDGRLISSRSTRDEDLKRNGCVDAGGIQPKPRGFKNPTFTRKRGLKTNPELTGRDPE